MNDTHIEKTVKVPDVSQQLPSPHFDDWAIAVAQPVQPIPPPRKKKRLLRSSLLLIAYLAFIIAVAGVTLFAPPSSREDTLTEAATSEPPAGTQADVNSAAAPVTATESTATPLIRRAKLHEKRLTRLRLQNQTMQIVEDAEGKPVARKVGEIRYGRSDRP